MKLFTLAIGHRHGTDITIHPTDEDANLALAEYVREWWDREQCGPMPDDPDQMISDYFQTTDEYSEISEHDLPWLAQAPGGNA